jgi:hypothetical protein
MISETQVVYCDLTLANCSLLLVTQTATKRVTRIDNLRETEPPDSLGNFKRLLLIFNKRRFEKFSSNFHAESVLVGCLAGLTSTGIQVVVGHGRPRLEWKLRIRIGEG